MVVAPPRMSVFDVEHNDGAIIDKLGTFARDFCVFLLNFSIDMCLFCVCA
jgi:hypothetical protein